VAQKLGLLIFSFKKLPNVNSHQKDENSPNLVTLLCTYMTQPIK
jgi:hypothetical protein